MFFSLFDTEIHCLCAGNAAKVIVQMKSSDECIRWLRAQNSVDKGCNLSIERWRIDTTGM